MQKIKIGDLVQYRGWEGITRGHPPLGLVVDQASSNSDFHHRIRVMWLGEEIPIQASVLSTKASRITAWVSPKSFKVLEAEDEDRC
jgi:hypothetical protein